MVQEVVQEGAEMGKERGRRKGEGNRTRRGGDRKWRETRTGKDKAGGWQKENYFMLVLISSGMANLKALCHDIRVTCDITTPTRCRSIENLVRDFNLVGVVISRMTLNY